MHPCPLCGKVVMHSGSMHNECAIAHANGRQREYPPNPGDGTGDGRLRWLESEALGSRDEGHCFTRNKKYKGYNARMSTWHIEKSRNV